MAAKAWVLDSGDTDLGGDITLVVARRSGKSLDGYKVEFEAGAGEEIRKVCQETLGLITARVARQYEASLRIDNEREYLAVPDAQLVQHESFRPKRRRKRGDEPVVTIETDPQVRDLLRRASGLERLAAPHLSKYRIQFYAAVVGSDPGTRTAFVRKHNPAKVLSRGGLVFSYGDRLKQISDPLMLLDDHFDLVIAQDGIAVLNQDVFEALFRDIEVIAERYPTYAKAFASLALDDEQRDVLVTRCRTDSRLGKRLREIYESGHLAAGNVTMSDVHREIKSLGLDATTLIEKGKLNFKGSNAGTILKLLNDDLFIGSLSKVAFEAGSKARRT